MRRLITAAVIIALLAACGTKGPLTPPPTPTPPLFERWFPASSGNDSNKAGTEELTPPPIGKTSGEKQ